MNINELRAFTDQQLQNPNNQRIQKHQMIRLRNIAAKHNAKMPKDSSFKNKVRAERIASLLGARGALASVDDKDGTTITHNGRQEPDGRGGENEVDKTAPIYPKSLLDIGYSNYNSRRNSEIRGQNLRRFAKQMRKNNTIREQNNMNIKEYYKQRLLNDLNEGGLMSGLKNLFRGGKTKKPPVHYAAASEVAKERAKLLGRRTRRHLPDGTWSERIGTGGNPRDIGVEAIQQLTSGIRDTAERRAKEVFNGYFNRDGNSSTNTKRFDRAYDSSMPERIRIGSEMRTSLKAIENPTGPRVPILRPPANRVIKKGPTILRPPIGFKTR